MVNAVPNGSGVIPYMTNVCTVGVVKIPYMVNAY